MCSWTGSTFQSCAYEGAYGIAASRLRWRPQEHAIGAVASKRRHTQSGASVRGHADFTGEPCRTSSLLLSGGFSCESCEENMATI